MVEVDTSCKSSYDGSEPELRMALNLCFRLQLSFRVCPKSPNRVLGLLGEGFGFGGLGFGTSRKGSRSFRVGFRL